MSAYRIIISAAVLLSLGGMPVTAQSSRSLRHTVDSLKNEIARIRDSVRIADITRSASSEFVLSGKDPSLEVPPVEKTPSGSNPGFIPPRRMDVATFEKEIGEDVSDDKLIRRLSDLNCPFPLPYSEGTRKRIKTYVSSKSMLETWLQRADYWFPVFEEALQRHGLPSELKYLAVIESLLLPDAQSRTDAYGLWQFVQGTADLKLISIPRTAWRDDRFDPYVATDAAARLLKSDFEILGSWPLVILSYNCGCNKVRKAMREAGSDDFWEIWDKLDYNEPKEYINLFVAAMYAMSYAEQHGVIGRESPLKAPLDTIMVRQPLHFQQISDLVGIPLDQIRFYNPQYRQDYIKGSDPATKTDAEVLRIPAGYRERFEEVRDTIYAYKRDSLFFNSRRGQSMGTVLVPKYRIERYRVGEYGQESAEDVASHFPDISAEDIVKWNFLPDSGTKLRGSTVLILKFPNSASYRHNSETFRKHMVQRGETLSSIARRYKVSVDDILKVNEGIISDKNNVPQGLVINLPDRK